MTGHRGLVRTEPSHKRLRILLGGHVVVDTDDALYVWESPRYPQYYVPMSDVAAGALKPMGPRNIRRAAGPATCFTVHGGDKEAVDAAWTYIDSPIEALCGRVRFDWDAIGRC